MIKLNNYINEAWSGVKKQSLKADIEAWCDDMSIEKYTINPQGEIDVNGSVELSKKDFEELPYKFGKVRGYFNMGDCKNLTSLKNCPNFVGDSFACDFCSKLDSLEGCPKEVGGSFWCGGCKQKFTKEKVMVLCIVKKNIEL